MKLHELIFETTEHDTIILRMAKDINKIIKKYDEDLTVYRKGKYLGKLGTLTDMQKDSPLEILNPVHIELINDITINRIGPDETPNKVLTDELPKLIAPDNSSSVLT